MNKAKYESLPADLKKVLDANSGIELSAFIGRAFTEGDVPGRKAAEARNNVIYTIPGSDLEPFRKAAQGVADDWVKEMAGKGHDGKKLIESARALIAKHSK
jgi:TRAP-type C4-dicarboxylate transport system substrate-binding protein